MNAFLPLAQAEWGTVPDWVTAFGTLAAFAVALRLLAKELTIRREAEEDRRREQARLVSAWTREPALTTAGGLTLAVIARNGSAEPIYQVHVVLVSPNSIHADDPEAATGQIGTVEVSRPILPPGEASEGSFPMFLGGERTGLVPGPVGISFTDAAGRRWKRYPDGRLIEPGRQRRSRKDYMNAWIAGELDHLAE